MDPNVALQTFRLNAAQMRADTNKLLRQTHAEDAIEAMEALDGWMSKGGFLPKAWDRYREYNNESEGE